MFDALFYHTQRVCAGEIGAGFGDIVGVMD
jgi:hypothetical protein